MTSSWFQVLRKICTIEIFSLDHLNWFIFQWNNIKHTLFNIRKTLLKGLLLVCCPIVMLVNCYVEQHEENFVVRFCWEVCCCYVEVLPEDIHCPPTERRARILKAPTFCEQPFLINKMETGQKCLHFICQLIKAQKSEARYNCLPRKVFGGFILLVKRGSTKK